jgi:predicted RNA-binding Zn ribbon-like protein
MRKRQDAPGELEVVRQFVNTADLDPGEEQLMAPADLRSWLAAHRLGETGMRVSSGDLVRALELREAIRAILLAHTDGSPAPAHASGVLDDAAARARLSLRFDEHGGARVQPAAPGVAGALGQLLTIVHAAIADGTWPQLKACHERTCAWAFYDHSKNHSGTWCAMQSCGNRAKARNYRERRSRQSAEPASGAAGPGAKRET